MKQFKDKELIEELKHRGFYIEALINTETVDIIVEENKHDVGLLTFVGKVNIIRKAHERLGLPYTLTNAVNKILIEEFL